MVATEPMAPVPRATMAPSTRTWTSSPTRAQTAWCHSSSVITAPSVKTCTTPEDPETRQLSCAAPLRAWIDSFH